MTNDDLTAEQVSPLYEALFLQDFAGHADPRTTLTYIRSRNRLSKSPANSLKY